MTIMYVTVAVTKDGRLQMIAIKTMNEMPRNCLECPAFDNCEDCEGYMNACGITNEYVGYIHDEPKIMIDKRPDSCPLTADVRENVKANLVIAGYKRNGSTQWFECSVCGGSVDFTDNFCKHCGAYFKGGTT